MNHIYFALIWRKILSLSFFPAAQVNETIKVSEWESILSPLGEAQYSSHTSSEKSQFSLQFTVNNETLVHRLSWTCLFNLKVYINKVLNVETWSATCVCYVFKYHQRALQNN
jgi:hypothetical protein